MKSIWIIQTETNLHVGNENTSSVGLIDKTIQRDVLTQIPCINASSLKGAMNEYATYELKMSPAERIAVFGVDKQKNMEDTMKGRCIFFDAQLLLLPVQDDNNLYRLVTSDEQIKKFLSLTESMGINYNYNEFLDALCNIDKHFAKTQNHILKHKEFKELCEDDELPIIARNCLDGKGNLWYEQALPSKAIFGTILVSEEKANIITKTANKQEGDSTEIKLPETISKFNNKIIQIGANATIGYGFCRFLKLKEE